MLLQLALVVSAATVVDGGAHHPAAGASARSPASSSPPPRLVRAWVGVAQGFWPNCSHHTANCAHNAGALGMIHEHTDLLDGVFLGCEVGLRSNGTVYLPADGAAQQCADGVAAIRAIRDTITVHGGVSVISCPMSQYINQHPDAFIESAVAFATRFDFSGLNIDWEACPYYCDASPTDGCSPAGFGAGVAHTINLLGKRLLETNRSVTLAIGVLKKGNNGAIVQPPYVYPNISAAGSSHPTSDITRLLRDSHFLERLTDMDTYYQNATDPMLNHPEFFEQCAKASQIGFGEKLGVGLGAYEAPFRLQGRDKANLLRVLQYLDSLDVRELDLFALDSRPGAACKTCSPGWPGPTPPQWWWAMLQQWKDRSVGTISLESGRDSRLNSSEEEYDRRE
jgi:hypothetical protein